MAQNVDESRQAGTETEIVVTAEMIEAGANVIADHPPPLDRAYVAELVYLAMVKAASGSALQEIASTREGKTSAIQRSRI